MNKSKMILAATGGVIGVAVLVMAYLVWSAYAAQTAAMEGDDESEGLETVTANASRLSQKKPYPCEASVKEVASNEVVVSEWQAEAFKLAARGDRPIKAITPAQFKTDMMEDAKRLLALPGLVQGKIAKPDFAFGPFKEYIAEGKMPSEQRLAELQRQWGDVTTIVELLAASGIAELTDVQIRPPEEEKAVEQPAKGKRAAKGKAAAGTAVKPSAQRYAVSFTTKPVGFVKCVNAFETSERFFAVDGFTFSRENDVIASALGGGDKKDASQLSASGGRRRRRGGVVVEQKEDENKPKNGIITDPLLDAPLKVEMLISSYDFKTLQETPKEEEKK